LPPLRHTAITIKNLLSRVPPPRAPEIEDYFGDHERALGNALGWQRSYDQQFRPGEFNKKFTFEKADLLAAHLELIVQRLDGSLSLPRPDRFRTGSGQNGADQLEWLKNTLERFAEAIELAAIDSSMGGPQPLPYPLWRRVPRDDLRDVVCGRLREQGRTAIVGMSGTGKTFLARDVWATIRGPKLWISAPKPLDGHAPTMADFAHIATRIVIWVAHCIPNREKRHADVRNAFEPLAPRIVSYFDLAKPDETLLYHAINSGDLLRVTAVLERFLPKSRNFGILSDLAKLFVKWLPNQPGDSQAMPTIVIDDLWFNSNVTDADANAAHQDRHPRS
jgi:hypothetical protein